jgi:carbonic anhydrase
MDRRQLLKGFAGLGLCPLCATPAFAQHGWSYSDPGRWGGTCSTGRSQSPIDIGATSQAALPPLNVAWDVASDAVVNNGHTIQVNFKPGGTLTVGNNRYAPLNQLHFHNPSEHLIGGKRFPMEIHFVHNYPARIAVIGVMMTPGRANPTFARIVASMPQRDRKVEVAGIDPRGLLPARQSYYRYAGSLTTPECTEGVEWMLLTDPVEVAAQDIQAFARLYPMNARPARKDNRSVQRSG